MPLKLQNFPFFKKNFLEQFPWTYIFRVNLHPPLQNNHITVIGAWLLRRTTFSSLTKIPLRPYKNQDNWIPKHLTKFWKNVFPLILKISCFFIISALLDHSDSSTQHLVLKKLILHLLKKNCMSNWNHFYDHYSNSSTYKLYSNVQLF